MTDRQYTKKIAHLQTLLAKAIRCHKARSRIYKALQDVTTSKLFHDLEKLQYKLF